MSASRFLRSLPVLTCLTLSSAAVVMTPTTLYAQAASTVTGTVADPDGGVIPGATVTLTPASGKPVIVKSGNDGGFSARVAPGTYSMTVTMTGFATFVREGVRVAGAPVSVEVKLNVQAENEVIQVQAQGAQISVDPASNASATVITGADLDALSDDPDDLASELSALAGPAAGPNGGEIYIDGFTGGQLPPKSSIREIRINQNPFSAQYDKVGFGRVEVFTKPGTDKFHGNISIQGQDKSLNTSNPFVQPGTLQPDYHTLFFIGSITGPITKTSSFSLGGSHRTIQDNSIINPTGFYYSPSAPTVLCAPGSGSACIINAPSGTNTTGLPNGAIAILHPQERYDFTPRIDLALGEKNTLTMRYQYEAGNAQNGGIGNLALASQAANTANHENNVQVSDTQLFGSKIVNETRVQFVSAPGSSNPTSTAPQLSISGILTGGGATGGPSKTGGIHFEFQNYTSIALSKNFIRFGGRLRTVTSTESSYANSNGTFTYTATPAVTNPTTGAVITPAISALTNYANGVVNQYTVTKINQLALSTQMTDVGLYVEDDWKARPNLTISYGMRYEAQNNINSAHDLAPRVSISYGVPRRKGNSTTVLRGGYGIFYDRFSIGNSLNVIEENGVNQINYQYKNPAAGCGPNSAAAIALCTTGGGTASNSIIQTTAANLRSAYTMQFAGGVDQQITKSFTLSVNYLHSQGDHEFFTRVLPVAGSNVLNYQYNSGGVFKENQITFTPNIRLKKGSVFGYYALSYADTNASSAGTALTSNTSTKIDYGPAGFVRRSQVTLGGNAVLPFKISASPFITFSSGAPYNITTGQDANGDGVYNDRPWFQPGAHSANCGVASSFYIPTLTAAQYNATNGAASQIPINYCTGPHQFSVNLRMTRTWGFGPKTGAAARQGGGDNGGGPGGGGPGGGGAPGGGGGGPRGGGGARGGGGGGRGGGGGGVATGRRYNVSLGGQAFNLFNDVPYSTPSGSLTSPQFGKSTSISGGSSAVRHFSLQLGFTF